VPSQTAARQERYDRSSTAILLLTFPEGFSMLWLAIVLLVAWVLGWAVFKVAGGLIHLLLVIAVVVFLYNLITGRRRV
jgi:Ca2+-dependent lipid-binding protein